MSVWASIHGEDPVFYADAWSDARIQGFLDVAVDVLDNRVRIICEPDGEIVLDAEGMRELHRRVFQARMRLEH